MDYAYGKIPDHWCRFIDSVGDGFITGGAYGCVVPFIRGFRGSPSGARLAAGAQQVLRNAPRHAGWMVAWSAVFSSVETALSLARRREDIWNPIAASAVGVALLNAHRGARAAALSAPVGAAAVAVPLGIIWYVSESHSRFMSWNDTLAYYDPQPGPAWIFADEKDMQNLFYYRPRLAASAHSEQVSIIQQFFSLRKNQHKPPTSLPN